MLNFLLMRSAFCRGVGEDWDIIDGAVKGGLEIEHKRAPWIFHYQHS